MTDLPPPRPPAPLPPPTPGGDVAATPATGGRNRRMIAAVVAVVVVVTAGVAWRIGADGDGSGGSATDNFWRQPVADLRDEPEEVWSTELGSEVLAHAYHPQAVVVAVNRDDELTVVALDPGTGDEKWSTGVETGDSSRPSMMVTGDHLAVYASADEGSPVTFIDAGSGEIAWELELERGVRWVADSVLETSSDDDTVLYTFDVDEQELGTPTSADEYWASVWDLDSDPEVWHVADDGEIIALDESLDATGFSYRPDEMGDIVHVTHLDGRHIVLTADTVIGLDDAGDEEWELEPDVGELDDVTRVGAMLIATGTDGAALVDPADGEIVDTTDVPYHVWHAVETDEGTFAGLVSDAFLEGFPSVVTVDVSDGTLQPVAETELPAETAELPGAPVGESVAYAVWKTAGGDEPGTHVEARDLPTGDELWSLEFDDDTEVAVSEHGLITHDTSDEATVRRYTDE